MILHKSFAAVVAIIVFCVTSTTHATTPITYGFSYGLVPGSANHPTSISGSITTDGALGPISANDITSWTFNDGSGGPGVPSFVASSSNGYDILTGYTGLYATPAGLFLNVGEAPPVYPGTSYGALLLEFPYNANEDALFGFSWTWNWLAPFSSGNPTSSPVPQYLYQGMFRTSSSGIAAYSTLGPATSVVPSLQQITPIPEPSALALLVIGTIGLAVITRKKSATVDRPLRARDSHLAVEAPVTALSIRLN